MKIYKVITTIAIASAVAMSPTSVADGLSDLKAALSKLNGEAPLSALVESSYTEKRGKKKKDQKIKNGLIQVNLSDTSQGFKLIFSNDVLAKLEQESNLKEQDEEAQTPTLNAVGGVGVSEMRRMLSAAPNLLRSLKKAEFVNEEIVLHEDKELRQLNFNLPLEAIIDNKEVHEYVDDFDASYYIKIDDSGIPVESKLSFSGSGSAYIFFTMDIEQSDTSTFDLVDDRLVNVKKTFQHKRRSTWGNTESSGYKVLIVSPPTLSVASIN